MTQTRYKSELHTPGNQSLGKPTIVRFDPEIQNEYSSLMQKRSELDARLRSGYNRQDAIVKEMGIAIAAGEDYKTLAKQLSDLRLEEEALESGIAHLNGQAGLLKRVNHWLK